MTHKGRAVSAKFAVKVALEVMTKDSLAEFVVMLPVQPVKPKPFAALAESL
jgi:hypothetical protein